MATNQQPPKGFNIVFTILTVFFLLGFMVGLFLGFTLGESTTEYKVGEWDLECVDDATFPGVKCYSYCGPKPMEPRPEEPQ